MQSIDGSLNYYGMQIKEHQLRQLKSAIRHFLLTGWGFPKPPARSTQQDMENAEYALSQLPMEKLYGWEEAINLGFQMMGKTDEQRSVPRSHVRKFVNWCLEAGVLADPDDHARIVKTSPPLLMGQGPRPKLRRKTIDLSAYALKDSEMNPTLEASLVEFRQYLTAPSYKGRRHKPVREVTADLHLTLVRRMLGWLHREQGVPQAELSLDCVIPVVNLEDAPQSEHVAEEFRVKVQALASFYQQRGGAAGGVCTFLRPFSRLVQFQYRGHHVDRYANDVPIMQVLRELMESYELYAKDELEPLLTENKWLELSDVIQKVTLPAFTLTEYKTKSKAERSLESIADNFQEALMWGVLSLNPPRRPGEWRTCKVVLACELTHKPQDLQGEEWIWPLPGNRRSPEELKYSYLTRQYVYRDPATGEMFGTYLESVRPSGRYLERVAVWFKDTPRQAAKSGDSHGYQKLPLMDRRVYRDKHFYDFLEAYVMGYWRDEYGNWVSVGRCPESPGNGFDFHELRLTLAQQSIQLQPWLFLGSRQGKQIRAGDFGGKFARVAYKFTGQFLTPHLLRSIFAVYMLERVGDRATLLSLADAMGHKLATLERIYDKRRSHQKTRLIEVTLSQHLDQICVGKAVGVRVAEEGHGWDFETIRQAVETLPPHQRRILRDSIA